VATASNLSGTPARSSGPEPWELFAVSRVVATNQGPATNLDKICAGGRRRAAGVKTIAGRFMSTAIPGRWTCRAPPGPTASRRWCHEPPRPEAFSMASSDRPPLVGRQARALEVAQARPIRAGCGGARRASSCSPGEPGNRPKTRHPPRSLASRGRAAEAAVCGVAATRNPERRPNCPG